MMKVLAARPAASPTALVRRTVIAAVLTVASLLGLQTTSASAAVPTTAGLVGYVSYSRASSFTAQVFATGALYPTPTAALNVPGVTAYRSPHIAGHQTIRQAVVVHKYVNGRWVAVNTPWQQSASVPVGYSQTTFRPQQFTYGPGYYSVVIAVMWYDAYGRLLGTTKLDYHHGADYGCATARCWIGNGFIAI